MYVPIIDRFPGTRSMAVTVRILEWAVTGDPLPLNPVLGHQASTLMFPSPRHPDANLLSYTQLTPPSAKTSILIVRLIL